MFINKALVEGRKLRLGLVGCGRISEKHFAAISEHASEIDLVSVCDSDASRREAAAKKYSAKAYGSLEAMLSEAPIDAVVISSPSGLHPQQAIICARAGKHVITEKPMATRWKDGLEMLKACDDAGVHLFVVKQNRFNPTLQLLKQAVQKNRFGRLYMMMVNVFWSRPQEYYDSAQWRGTWEFDGGALMNQASHYIDLMDWLMGPVESVQCMAETIGRRIEVEDTAVMNVRWRSGALGSANVTMLTYDQNLEGSITILGEKGTVKVGGVAINKVETWKFADKDPMDETIHSASYETTSVYGNGHVPYYKNVIDVLKYGAQPLTNGREGLRSLELLTAAYLSSRSGQKVSLPLEF